MIMMVQSIYKDSVYLQASVVQQILTVYLIIIIRVRPYQQHSANAIELYNIILCLFNMILVNAIHQGLQTNHYYSALFFAFILIVLNLLFITVFMIFFFRQQVIYTIEQIIQLKFLAVKKFPNFKKMKTFQKLISGYKMNYINIWKKAHKMIKKNNFQLFDQHHQQIVHQSRQNHTDV